MNESTTSAAPDCPRCGAAMRERNGRPLSRAAQVELAGNSVCPPLAAAVVGANLRGRRMVA